MMSVFVMAPEYLFINPQSRVLTAHELPCEYMDLWLLIACDTAFYAMIKDWNHYFSAGQSQF